MATVKKLTDENNKLLQLVEKSVKGIVVPGGSTHGGGREQHTTQIEIDPNGYCWSHGCCVRKGH
eukprot:3599347-Ditylum_brightwellii.AAC.1